MAGVSQKDGRYICWRRPPLSGGACAGRAAALALSPGPPHLHGPNNALGKRPFAFCTRAGGRRTSIRAAHSCRRRGVLVRPVVAVLIVVLLLFLLVVALLPLGLRLQLGNQPSVLVCQPAALIKLHRTVAVRSRRRVLPCRARSVRAGGRQANRGGSSVPMAARVAARPHSASASRGLAASTLSKSACQAPPSL